MRLLLDTNTALSGLLWDGPPGRLIDLAIAQKVLLYSSTALLSELEGVIRRPKFAPKVQALGVSVGDLVLGYSSLVTVVIPAPISPTVLEDPDDDHVLAAAIEAKVDLIVSGDRHLLGLAGFQGCPIVDAGTALSRLGFEA